MLSVAYKPFMRSVIMLNVIMLIDIMLSVVAPFKILRYTFAQDWGVRRLTGENLKLVWAEFSTIS